MTGAGSVRAALVLIAGCLLPAGSAAGQLADSWPWSSALGGGELFVAPRLQLDAGSFRVGAESLLGGAEDGYRGVAASAAWLLPSGPVLRLVLDRTHRSAHSGSAVARDGDATGDARESSRDTRVRAAFHGERAGVEVGLLDRRASLEALERSAAGLEVRAWIDVGPTLGVRLTRLDVREDGEWVRQRVVTLLDRYDFISEKRVSRLESYHHTAVEVDVGERVGRVRLGAVAGWGVSDGPVPDRRWAHLTGVVPVTRHLDAVAAAGLNGGLPSIGREPATFAQLGFRMHVGGRPSDAFGGRAGGATPEPAPSGPAAGAAVGTAAAPAARVEARPGSEGGTLVLVARGAHRVEVRGDFTLWEAEALLPGADGSWSLPVEPGVFRFNVRVDGGAWTAPAGLPNVPDEFTGEPVAVAVVR